MNISFFVSIEEGGIVVFNLPSATKLGQGYVFTHVCDSVHRGGLPHCMLGYPPRADTPWDQVPPGADSPPPQSRHPSQDQAPPGADIPQSIHLLLGPGTPQDQAPKSRHPPSTVHAARYGQQASGMHPTGMQSCFIVIFRTFQK